MKKIKKTMFMEECYWNTIKEIAQIETNGNMTQVYNEFIEFGLICYKMTKLHDIKLNEMTDIFRKGLIHYVSEQRRSTDNNSDKCIIEQVFD